MNLENRSNHRIMPKPSRLLYDVVIKKHQTSMVVLKFVIDEHLYTVIENLIKTYQVKTFMEE
jgi:hypothetical protein